MIKQKLNVPIYPSNWKLLSPEDMKNYHELQSQFHHDIAKSRKGERLDMFLNRLNKIKNFIERGDCNDWRRSVVCGIFFLDSALAIQIQQLRIMLGRCKSSINGSLQQLGYSAQTQLNDVEQQLAHFIPVQYREAADIKKWTLRKNVRLESKPSIQQKRSTFIIPIPDIYISKPEISTEAKKIVKKNYPCPVKCRYKYYDIVYQSVSIQTEA